MNLKQELLSITFVIFLYANERMVLELLSIDSKFYVFAAF